MEKTPFTLGQVAEICEDFEDLIDTEFTYHSDPPIKLIIDHVAIAPFANPARENFVNNYLSTRDPHTALGDYDGPDYDVLILAQNAEAANEIIVLDIRQYVAENNVGYNFPQGTTA